MADVNKTALGLRNENWEPVKGVGPSRNFYLLSNEVIRGAREDGFHRNERPLVGKVFTMDGVRYCEYPGFVCANRPFKVLKKYSMQYIYTLFHAFY